MIYLNTNTQNNNHIQNNRYQRTSNSNDFSSQIFQKNDTKKLIMLLNLMMRLIQQLSAEQNNAPRADTQAPQEKTKTNSPQIEATTPSVILGEEKQKNTNKSDLPNISVSDPRRFENEEKPQQAKHIPKKVALTPLTVINESVTNDKETTINEVKTPKDSISTQETRTSPSSKTQIDKKSSNHKKELNYVNGKTFHSDQGSVTFKDGRFELQRNDSNTTFKGSYGIHPQGGSLFTAPDQSPNSEQVGAEELTVIPDANTVIFQGKQYELQPSKAQQPEKLSLTNEQNDILQKKLIPQKDGYTAGSVSVFDTDGDKKLSVGDKIKFGYGFEGKLSNGEVVAGDAAGEGTIDEALLKELQGEKPIVDPEESLVPLTDKEMRRLEQAVLFSEGVGAPEATERLDSVIDKDGNGKLSVGDALKIVGTKNAETGDFTPVVRFETLTQEQLNNYNGNQAGNQQLELAPRQKAIIRDQFQIPARAEVSVTDSSNDNQLSAGDTLTTKLDGKTFTQTITTADIQEIDRVSQLEGEKANLAENRQKWKSAGITEYSFTQLNSGYPGYGPKPQEGLYGSPIRVGVDSQGIEDITQRSSFSPVPVASIDDMFDEIDQALSQKNMDVSVKYDKEMGYPTEIKISHHNTHQSFYNNATRIGQIGNADAPVVNRTISDLKPGAFGRPGLPGSPGPGYPDNNGVPVIDVHPEHQDPRLATQQEGSFYDWFKKEHGDYNQDGKFNTEDVTTWLKNS